MTDRQPNIHQTQRRRFLKGSGVVAIGALTGCLGSAAESGDSLPASDTSTETQTATEASGDATTVRVKQDRRDGLVYWVLPGKRRLSEKVFGTPDNPKALVQPKIEEAEKPAVEQLLEDDPLIVGLPEDARETNEDETEYTRSKIPTPFSDKAQVIDGRFDVTYEDRREEDQPGEPTDTPDDIEFDARFFGPEDNDYRLEVKKIFQPGLSIPGYETGGGVRTDFVHHGTTGTGSPLMAEVYTWGALYGIGNVLVNGEVTDERKVMHIMTTQIVRDKDYRLAIDEELPLDLENTIAGQAHHTHGIVQPVTITEEGKPKYEPLTIPFKPPGEDKPQPFIHVMFENDEIVEAPFEPQIETQTPRPAETETTAEEAIPVNGREYLFDPEQVKVRADEEVTITFRNVGTIAHNFTVGAFGARTPTIQPGDSASVTFTPDEEGTFPFWCAVPGHREEGMEGTLIVS